MLGGIGGRRRRGQQRMRWLHGITDSMDMSLGKLRVSATRESTSAAAGTHAAKIYFYGFPGGSVVKNPPANARNVG